MALTGNFSLRYPTDLSLVDIAQDMQNLAEDVDTQLGTRLALTGGTLTGNLTISKATPTLTINSTSSNAYMLLQAGASGDVAGIDFRTSTSRRWILAKNSTAESSTATGSDLVIQAYDNTASLLSTPVIITRSTGLTTLTSLTVSGNTIHTGTTTLTGNVVSNLTISKATPVLSVSSTSGISELSISRPAGTLGRLRFLTGSSERWRMQVNSIAESGSNAGSNFEMYRYDDAASVATVTMGIRRSTGRVTFYDAGSDGGVELNSSGPRLMSGTGSPEGVVSAPVGSIWYQTDGTMANGTHWRKAKNATSSKGWVAMGGIGNLLTTNEATFESGTINQSTTDGDVIYPQHGTLSVSTTTPLTGTYCLALAITSTSPRMQWYGSSGNTVAYMPVVPGRTYTWSLWSRSDTVNSSPPISVTFRQADGTNISSIAGETKALTANWQRWQMSVTAPANAALVSLVFGGFGSTWTGHTIYFDNVGFWEGTGGTWQPPGTPISDLGTIVGSGSPEGQMAAPQGSIYYDTVETNGAKRWRKGDSTARGGWVVMDGDTGMRNIAASYTCTWGTINEMKIRRVGNVVHFVISVTASSMAGGANYLGAQLPSGFQPSSSISIHDQVISDSLGASTANLMARNGATLGIYRIPAANLTWRGYSTWTTNDAWPTSLPGTAA